MIEGVLRRATLASPWRRWAVVSALGGGLLVATSLALHAAKASLESAEARLAGQRSAYAKRLEDRRLSRQYGEAFRRLRSDGLIDGEPTGLLATAQRQARTLPSARFEVASPVPIPDENHGSLAVMGTAFVAHLGLVHEGQLVRFLAGMRAASPLARARHCELVRAAGSRRFAPRSANISARCELLWVTVHTGADGQEEDR